MTAAEQKARSVRAPDPAMVERMRAVFMKRHHHKWEMETVSNAAHLVAEVVAHTGRDERAVRDEVDGAVSLFQHDTVRQLALDALRDALRKDVAAS
jgi:hypothetical protein